jgi:hypothetical protein
MKWIKTICISMVIMLLAAVSIIVSSPCPVKAAETTLYATEDAEVQILNPDTNYGDELNAFVEFYTTDSKECRLYIKFDLSSIPAGSTINSATLRLKCGGYANEVTHSVYKVTGDNWNESTLKWNNMPSVAGTATATISVGGTGWHEWTVTSDVSSWVSGGSNYGWRIDEFPTEDTIDNSVQYHTSETAISKPELVVNYSPPPTIELTAPSTINLGSLYGVSTDANGSSSTAGTVLCTYDNGYILEIESNDADGKMSNDGNKLNAALKVTADLEQGTGAVVTQGIGDDQVITTTKQTVGTTATPSEGMNTIALSVKQPKQITGTSGAYNIILTFTTTANE